MKDLVTLVAVVGLVIVGLFAVTQDKVVQENSPLGAFPGGELLTRLATYAGFVQGGVYTIATSSATITIGGNDLSNASVIMIRRSSTTAAFDPALTATLPATTSWKGLNKVGDRQEWVIDNQQTAAGTTTTFAAGTGVDIDGTGANDDVINGGVSGLLKCWRLPTSDIRCIIEEMVDAG
jgi:hypothetical protein